MRCTRHTLALAAVLTGASCGDGTASTSSPPLPRSPAVVSYLLPESDDLLGRSVDGDFLAHGSVAILDAHSGSVLIITQAGRSFRVGRRGEGPGEFSGDLTLALAPNPRGGVDVVDMAHGRISRFDSEFELVETVSAESQSAREWRPTANGHWFVRSRREGEERLLLVGTDGAVLDSAGVIVEPMVDGPSAEDQRWPLIPDWVLWDADSHGTLAVGRIDQQTIGVFCRGERLAEIDVAGPVVDLGPSDLQHLWGLASVGMGVAEPDWRVAEPALAPPDFALAVGNLLVDDTGVVILQRPRDPKEMTIEALAVNRRIGFGGRELDLFDLSGRHLAALTLEANAALFRARNGRVLGVFEDAVGRQRPFILELSQNLAGLQPSSSTPCRVG